MKVLALDSTGMVAAVAVMEDLKLIAEIFVNHRKTHSQTLLPMVEDVLDRAELSIKDIDVFGVAIGPGSFTGIRIGIATVKALAQAVEKPVAGINTLDGLAYNVPYYTGRVCPIMDARRDQVYTALYRWERDSLRRESDYMGIHMEEYIQFLQQESGPVVFLGDGVPVYGDLIIEKMGSQALFAPSGCSMQRASSIASLALEKARQGLTVGFMELQPFYLRKSQAEREYDRKCALALEEKNGEGC